MVLFTWLLLLSLTTQLPATLSEDCPRVIKKGNETLQYPLNVRDEASTNKSEFLCDFIWTDEKHLAEKLLDRMTQRQKVFIRFTVPVIGYNNPYLNLSNHSGYLTWAWVLDTHDYMLYYPHNFIVTSLKTMGIITQDWAIDYHGLKFKSFGFDDDDFDTDDTVGYCDKECVKVNQSCGIGKYELEQFLVNFNSKYKWSWLCLQAPYDTKDIVSVPQFPFPDLLYYWRFLKMFFSRRSITNLGRMQSKTDFPHYYCYNEQDHCELKELLSHYWVIVFIGFILWLYSPLLIHYFPSSTAKIRTGVPKGMFPSYKTPIYFGRCLKSILCFYKQKGLPWTKWWIRLRRFLFLTTMAVTSFRLLSQPPYYYYAWPTLVVLVVAVVLVPEYLSECISAELPTKFLLWDLPPGIVRPNKNLREYQQLAHVMQERLYLTVDYNFWMFLLRNSYRFFLQLIQRPIRNSKDLLILVLGIPPSLYVGTAIFVIAFLWNILLYFIPLVYFYIVLLRATCVGEWQYIQAIFRQDSFWWKSVKTALACCQAIVLIIGIHYTLAVLFIWCYATSEFTMFTFIGGVLTSSIAFQYFVLVGSVVTAIYTLVNDLHKEYNSILKEVTDLLSKEDTFEKLVKDINTITTKKTVLNKDKEKTVSVSIKHDYSSAVPHSTLVINDSITTYLDKNMFDCIIERCKPLRRQIFFIILKIIGIFFYSFIALWVKNVYHLEDQVRGIFAVVSTVAVYFLPSLLQFISYKSQFGKQTDVVLRQNIYEALVMYLTELS